MVPDSDSNTKRFDAALGELEQIVGKLESGDLPLEDALVAFEQGIGLVRLLNEKLDRAERQVEVLSRDPEGRLQVDTVDRLREDTS